jgi:cytochrome-b5 reductase
MSHAPHPAPPPGAGKPAISPDAFASFALVAKTVVSPNTASYRFALPTEDGLLGLPIGQHISLATQIDGKDVVRSYTPTSRATQRGHFDLLIKTYPAGKMSSFVAAMAIGDTIRVRGPKGNFRYARGCVRALAMIAGGTGITPMYQIIQHILEDPADTTAISLIFANNGVEDILLKEQLDGWAAEHPGRFRVTYIVGKAGPEWTGPTGFVNKELWTTSLPAFADGVKLLLCGPPPMIKAMTGIAEELGWPKANPVSKMEDAVFKF